MKEPYLLFSIAGLLMLPNTNSSVTIIEYRDKAQAALYIQKVDESV